MSIASVIGSRNAQYTENGTTKQILQLASVTALTDKVIKGENLTYSIRGAINDLRNLVGKTSNDNTYFSFQETSAFVDVQSTWYYDYAVRGYVVFKTPRGFQTVNFRNFNGESSGTWNIGNEINRQMNLYADGYMPNGAYVDDYNCANWIWIYANLTVKFVEREGE